MPGSESNSESYEEEFQRCVALSRGKSEMADEFKAIIASQNVIYSLRLLILYGGEIKNVQKYREFMRIAGEVTSCFAEVQNELAEQIRRHGDLKGQVVQLKKELEALKGEDSKSMP